MLFFAPKIVVAKPTESADVGCTALPRRALLEANSRDQKGGGVKMRGRVWSATTRESVVYPNTRVTMTPHRPHVR